MAEPSRYLTFRGQQDDLHAVLVLLAGQGCFAPDTAGAPPPAREEKDPYAALLTRVKAALSEAGLAPGGAPRPADCRLEAAQALYARCRAQLDDRTARRAALERDRQLCAHTRHQLRHLEKMDVNLDEIFALTYVKVRFGRLPQDGYRKLPYYAEREFSFHAFDFDGEYYWGFYFAPAGIAGEVDAIFASLDFERLRVPDFVHGTPTEALARLQARELELDCRLEQLAAGPDAALAADLTALQGLCGWLAAESRAWAQERYVRFSADSFVIAGTLPASEVGRVIGLLSPLCDCRVVTEQADDAPARPSFWSRLFTGAVRA